MNPRDPRVIHVVVSLDVGGLERVVLDLIRHGKTEGRDVAVVCLERPGTLAHQAEAIGAEVYCMEKPPGIRPETVDRLRVAFAQFRPDIIHTHQIGALFYAGPAARREGMRAVVHTEHIDHTAKRTRVLDQLRIRLLWGLAGRHAKRFFGVSDEIAEAVSFFGVVPRGKVRVVRNGIDTTTFAPSYEGPRDAMNALGVPEGSEVVGTVGRLVEVKRQGDLIRGFALVAATRPRAMLVIVGDGPDREALSELTESLSLDDRVFFAGYQDRPELLVREMDVFALTSRLEGLPLAILEAWAAAVPVVATAVGGVASLIRDGQDGCLVPFDDASAIARTIVGLLSDPARARRIGEAGRVRAVCEFDVSVMALAYDQHYLEVLLGDKAINEARA